MQRGARESQGLSLALASVWRRTSKGDAMVVPSSSRNATGTKQHVVALIEGDGIGPEVVEAVRQILVAAEAPVTFQTLRFGASSSASKVLQLNQFDRDILNGASAILKAPMTTPQGGGHKSLNVFLRKELGLFANVRPSRTLPTDLKDSAGDADLVIIRENEEDLYVGIEYRTSRELFEAHKFCTRAGSERIIRYAFEFAQTNRRRRVTCMTKDNNLKMTDGLFHSIFLEVSREYPEISAEHLLVDFGAARLATRPHTFDVIVTPNLYGDILSDIAAEVLGSVGTAGSANIGEEFALFEAVHGTAPDIAGRGVANPTGMLQAAILMLGFLDEPVSARRVNSAWVSTVRNGIVTADMGRLLPSSKIVKTREFADAIVRCLSEPEFEAKHVSVRLHRPMPLRRPLRREVKSLRGVDVWLEWQLEPGDEVVKFGQSLAEVVSGGIWELESISNQGNVAYPRTPALRNPSDAWGCRFIARTQNAIVFADVLSLLALIHSKGFDITKMYLLSDFDGQPGWTEGFG